MAKKTLNEAVVRRFQKLANMSPINEMYTQEQYMKEEEADLAPAGEDAGAEDMGAPEGEEMDMGDMDGEKSIDVEQGDLQAVVDAIPALQNIADALGGVLGDEGEDAEMDLDMDAEDMGAPSDEKMMLLMQSWKLFLEFLTNHLNQRSLTKLLNVLQNA